MMGRQVIASVRKNSRFLVRFAIYLTPAPGAPPGIVKATKGNPEEPPERTSSWPNRVPLRPSGLRAKVGATVKCGEPRGK